ncbi:MAG: Hsp20/alpha crystallin family protein [Deltaproteobacteria bacterium]|nr:Hsp20/alpha crystallin family protein [Deltaproteobacteria bacterium]
MAKISKKTPGTLPSVEIDNLNQFIFEGLEDTGIFSEPEPITHIPNIDMFSTPAEVVVEVELPGVRKQDIEISIYKNNLTIRALKFECFEEDKINYVCMERSFGRLFRTMEIPFPVDTEKIKAVYKNGLLTISIPRIEDKRRETKRVPIESI